MLECGEETGDVAKFLREAHRRPLPAVAQGQVLASAGVRTAMDVSDGLVDDLGKLCSASGVAARVRASTVPMHPSLRQRFPEDCLSLALGGGEDYVLLFTGPPDILEPLIPQLGEGSAVIGHIEAAGPAYSPGEVLVVDDDGREVSLDGKGWDHFRGS